MMGRVYGDLIATLLALNFLMGRGKYMNSLKVVVTFLTISFAFVCFPARAQSDQPLPPPVATITVDLKVYAMATGQKANISSGILTYQGKQYPLTIKGIGLYANQIGASHLVASGEVYNLNSLADFAGTYFFLSGGMEETGSSKIRSDKNVIVALKGWSRGPVVIQPGGSTIQFTMK